MSPVAISENEVGDLKVMLDTLEALSQTLVRARSLSNSFGTETSTLTATIETAEQKTKEVQDAVLHLKASLLVVPPPKT